LAEGLDVPHQAMEDIVEQKPICSSRVIYRAVEKKGR